MQMQMQIQIQIQIQMHMHMHMHMHMQIQMASWLANQRKPPSRHVPSLPSCNVCEVYGAQHVTVESLDGVDMMGVVLDFFTKVDAAYDDGRTDGR